MTDSFLTQTMRDFLEKSEFVYLATADAAGHPYVAPKFLIKTEKESIYLAEFVFGRTIENIKIRPQASFSIIDMDDLTGYQMNGTARIIGEGEERDQLFPHLSKRQLHFSVERIVEGIQRGKKHGSFEAAFPEHFAAIEVNIEEIIDIFPTGKVLKRSKPKK